MLEEPDAGRIRVVVRDAKTGALVPRVQVRVIGSENQAFFTGQTDLRGVYVAEGVAGQVTAVARQGAGQYAFYRGKSRVGAAAKPAQGKSPRPSRAIRSKATSRSRTAEPGAADRTAPGPLPLETAGGQAVLKPSRTTAAWRWPAA